MLVLKFFSHFSMDHPHTSLWIIHHIDKICIQSPFSAVVPPHQILIRGHCPSWPPDILSHLQSSSPHLYGDTACRQACQQRWGLPLWHLLQRRNMLRRPAHGKGQPASVGSKSWTGRLKTAETGRPRAGMGSSGDGHMAATPPPVNGGTGRTSRRHTSLLIFLMGWQAWSKARRRAAGSKHILSDESRAAAMSITLTYRSDLITWIMGSRHTWQFIFLRTVGWWQVLWLLLR